MKGPKEKLLYVVCVQPNKDHVQGDYLATVDVDPESSIFQQVNINENKRKSYFINNILFIIFTKYITLAVISMK